MRPINILHINLQKSWRGGEQQLIYLLNGLYKLGHHPMLICNADSELRQRSENRAYDVIPIQTGYLKSLCNIKLLAKIIKDHQIDIIHCHESKGLGLAIAVKLTLNKKIKIVLHRRVVFPISGFISKRYKYSEKYVNHVICVSPAVENIFSESSGNHNTSVILDMIDTSMPSTSQIGIKETIGLNENTKIIGYIAALTPEKDHVTFLNTAKIITQTESNIHFVLIGDGKLRQQLEKQTSALGLSHCVTFMGFIDNPKSLLYEMDLLLFTSKEEGLGSTILDAFFAKCPVVATKNGGINAIITSGVNGYLSPVGDNKKLAEWVVFLLHHQKVSDAITEKGFDFVVAHCNEDTICRKIVSVYTDLIST